MFTECVDLITCLTRFLDEETRNIPTVCSPNCSRCRIHIMTTVGTQGEENVPDMLSSATSSMDKASSMPVLWPRLCRRKSKRLSVEPANKRDSCTEPKLARLSLRLALVTGLRRTSSMEATDGMSIPVVVSAHVDRLRLAGRSTHWPRGTPNTGPRSPPADPPAEGAACGFSLFALSHLGKTFFFNK